MNQQNVRQWVNHGPDLGLLKMTEQLGSELAKGSGGKLTTSQIRQVFTKLKAIEAKGFDLSEQRLAFMMLKPFLAYASGRDSRNEALKTFKNTMTWGIDAVLEGDSETETQRFNHFCKLFEAVLAYHRAHGGK
ncbi:type III-A CRISPR-associated protein Csm2 [Desulfobulbus oligotrophicus]|jgi:CRISPR-associated protein Csm2|uniref:CRISPR system Cms protein Csm2 n=1 Tax=Desulfobulbus oligotrophicus TaxID=1909699 RepID=A0A7T6ARJ0_9BACT|nr:type III-A CRISPR-associated protein Csm2 [Desulfobulbus oligotrophicus]MDY0389767.1 type III-A CRISPR-associated protein Csm2 [Desulfobulbus oligotrophicus]QQG66592.1 type III-A CRISPR-associated protein Csm2 [Desulfobulbus oligotrophicus]